MSGDTYGGSIDIILSIYRYDCDCEHADHFENEARLVLAHPYQKTRSIFAGMEVAVSRGRTQRWCVSCVGHHLRHRARVLPSYWRPVRGNHSYGQIKEELG